MRIHVGIIGAGVMGADHARTLVRSVGGAEVVAIADADADRARGVAADLGVRRTYVDGHALIADPAVGAVLIASPDDTHAALVLACITARKPVLCEKPLAATLSECETILQAEISVGRRLIQVGFMRRFDPGYAAMKLALRAGHVGAPVMLHCIHHNASVPDFFTADMVITNSAVHEIDIARWLLDEEMAQAMVFAPYRSAASAAVGPTLVVLETVSGVTVDVGLHLNAGYGYDVRAELVGESGTLARLPQDTVAVRADGEQRSSLAADWRAHFEAAYRLQLREWVDSLRTGRPVGASAWDGYAATATAMACLAAAASGRRTDVQLMPRPDFYA